MIGIVGRDHELQALRDALLAAIGGRGSLCLIAGEAGIGKTCLAAALAADPAASPVRVHWGCAWESGGAPPYWPWIEILRGLDDVPSATRLLDASSWPAAETVGRATRSERYDDVSAALVAAGACRPRLLILDDLHLTDEPTLVLLEAVAERLGQAAVMIVGIVRSITSATAPPVRPTLSRLLQRYSTLNLPPLSADAVAALASSGSAPPDLDPQVLYDASGGNPLFVLALLRQRSPAGRVPDEVRGVIAEHLEPLPPASRRLLETAAVLGRCAEVNALAALHSRIDSGVVDRSIVSAALETAAAEGLLRAEAPGTYVFVHGLVRQLVYEAIPLDRRERLHALVGADLESRASGVYEIAFHHLRSARLDNGKRALPWLRKAAVEANASLAFEEAERLLLEALALLDSDAGSSLDRCEVLHAIGEARWKAGRYQDARSAFLEVVGFARSAGLWEPMARALIAMSDESVTVGRVDWAMVHLLEEAVRLGPADGPLQAALLATLAYALYSAPEQAEWRVTLSRRAVDSARGCADPTLLGHTLERFCWALWGPETTEERLRTAIELSHVAAELPQSGLRISAHALAYVARYELGDADGGDAEMAALEALVAGSGAADYRGGVAMLKATQALLRGDLAAGEEWMDAALRAARPNDRNQVQNYAAQLWLLRELQGRLGELEPLVLGFVSEYPGVATWRAALAVLYCDQGRSDEARQVFDEIAGAGFGSLPRDVLWLTTIMGLARVCATLGDAGAAVSLYDLLLPYRDRNIVLSGGVASYGAAALYLGRLAVTLQRWPAAFGHFEEAVILNRRLRAWPALATTLCEYARSVRSAPTELRPCTETELEHNLDEAGAIAARLGLVAIRLEANRLREARSTPIDRRFVRPPQPTRDAVPAQPIVHLRREGKLWTLRRQSSLHRLRSGTGMQYLAYLLRQPGVDIPVVELAAGAVGPGSSSGSILRSELRDLRLDLVQAEADHDVGRTMLLRERLDYLTQAVLTELGRVSGEQPAAAQYARVNVGRAVARAIAEISRLEAFAGSYLAATIRTGWLCSYSPDPHLPMLWEVEM